MTTLQLDNITKTITQTCIYLKQNNIFNTYNKLQEMDEHND